VEKSTSSLTFLLVQAALEDGRRMLRNHPNLGHHEDEKDHSTVQAVVDYAFVQIFSMQRGETSPSLSFLLTMLKLTLL
jgi:hypothetical protein